MSQAPSAVVFDFGGVLVDWNPRYLYRKLLSNDAEVERFLSEVTTPEWNLEQDRGRPWSEAVATLTAQFPEHRELIVAYHERWAETIGGQIDGTVQILTELRDAGVALYGLTNWSAETFPIARERFEWLSWFKGIVVSGEEGLVKPDPRIYRVLEERYGVDLGRAVYIDDSPRNVVAASELGMTALHFTSPEELRHALGDLLP
ncbi:HAD family phosphatase [Phytoactinopolyspora alkaliphila]|uniref:HAD family phosphatase n=1 Tax=Phytoactinopolyspora alkaliphila TaxID=1783498 RepID=A0A6N9YGB0_9ACTN|nr:HAD family phosphatase [Phytoactinopolyspora alkaliphila]NED93948.1 HAD family phosphatase [Phytoactinopolyspora alkaliphila]